MLPFWILSCIEERTWNKPTWWPIAHNKSGKLVSSLEQESEVHPDINWWILTETFFCCAWGSWFLSATLFFHFDTLWTTSFYYSWEVIGSEDPGWCRASPSIESDLGCTEGCTDVRSTSRDAEFDLILKSPRVWDKSLGITLGSHRSMASFSFPRS